MKITHRARNAAIAAVSLLGLLSLAGSPALGFSGWGVSAPFHLDTSTGACCTSDGTCTITFQQGCQTPDIWQGATTTCDPTNPCPTTGVSGPSPEAQRLQVLTAPNPSAGGVVIRCLLPLRALTTLVLFDASGRVVRRLHEGELPAEETPFSWDGRDDAGRAVPAGVYLVKVTTPTGEASGRVVLTR